jgi:thiol:disulfide interchange protein DsbD
MGQGVLGGLVLNVMPCVFPVLFFKLSGIINHASDSARARRIDALGYLAGTLATFAAYAAVVIALRATGTSLGWGMQMQNPAFVAAIVALLFAFGLNALGVFHIEVAVGGNSKRSGWLASFGDGAMVTLVSTPCSAPILGGATAAALAREAHWWETLSLFWSIGFGLALPVVIIGFIPALNKRLPKPGAWMETMKLLVAFSLFGAAIWFFETLQVQVTPASANLYLYFLLILGGALGAWQRIKAKGWTRGRTWLATLTVVGLVGVAGWRLIGFEARERSGAPTVVVAAGESSVRDGKIVWTEFSVAGVAEARARGQAVFVDFTADWCATCKVFEKTHINTDEVRAAFQATGVLAMKADLTAQDSQLWDVLAELGRSGLPTYAFYLPDGRAEVLPEGPPNGLAEKLRSAAPPRN